MLKQLQKKYLGSTIPVINIHGAITPQMTEQVAKRLSKISTTTASALAVSVNSPGGLPVQSLLICNKIRDFAYKNNLKVHTFAKDLAASGGYFVLSSGNHVVADRTSIVGNIGAVIAKYELDGLLDIASLQYKNLTSNKESLRNSLSPFHKLTPEERQQLQSTCGWVHQGFINQVKKHRGNKIKNDPTVFSGEVYTGSEAQELGLVDEVGSMVEVLERLYPGARLELGKARGWRNAFF